MQNTCVATDSTNAAAQPALYQYDVNQLFKDMQPREVMSIAEEVTAWIAQQHHVHGITILHAKHLQGLLGGQRWTSKGVYIEFEELLRVTKWYLESAFFRLGDLVVEQSCGCRMGGKLSKALSSLTLSGLELRWWMGRSIRAGYGLTHWH